MRTINRDSLFCLANCVPQRPSKTWYNIWCANIALSDHHFPLGPHKWVNKYKLCVQYKPFGEPLRGFSDRLCMCMLLLSFSLNGFYTDLCQNGRWGTLNKTIHKFIVAALLNRTTYSYCWSFAFGCSITLCKHFYLKWFTTEEIQSSRNNLQSKSS